MCSMCSVRHGGPYSGKNLWDMGEKASSINLRAAASVRWRDEK